MADVFDTFEILLREQIESTVYDGVLESDDVSLRLVNLFEPVSRAGRTTDGSAGWEASWRMRIQRGGRVSGGTFTGNTPVLMGHDADLAMGRAADAKYLDPANTPKRAHKKIVMLLKRMRGSIVVELQELLAELATEPIDEVVVDNAEDALFQHRLVTSAMFWGDGSGMLAQVNSPSGNISVGEGTSNIQEVPLEVGTYARFTNGMRVVAGSNVAQASYGASARTARTGSTSSLPAGVMRVVDVDMKNRQISLESEPGQGTVTLQDNDALILEGMVNWSGATVNAQSLAPQGIESLLIESGNFPGTSIDVTEYTQFASFVEGDEAAPEEPEPDRIAKIIDLITDSGKPAPPVLVSEQSVKTRNAYLERNGFMQNPVPQGAAFMGASGVAGTRMQHWDHSFNWLTSAMCRPNALHGLTPNTFKRFQPIGGNAIRWAHRGNGPNGTPSIFREVTEGRVLTEMYAADFDFFLQYGLTDPRVNFRYLGLVAQRDI